MRAMHRQRLTAGLVALAILVGVAVVFAADGFTGTAKLPASLLQYTPPSKGGGGGGGGGSSALPPDLHVDVRPSATVVPAVGGELDYYVTVSTLNRGGSSNASLTLNLPGGWTYDSSYADRGPGCTGSPPVLVCNVGWINPSAVTHVSLFGKVAEAGTLTLVATVKSLQEPEANPSDNQVTVAVGPQAPPPTPNPGPSPSPVTVAAPAVLGAGTVGSVLRVVKTTGARIQWQLCTRGCRPIRGATRAVLKLLPSYLGKTIRVVVTKGSKTTVSRRVRVKLRAR